MRKAFPSVILAVLLLLACGSSDEEKIEQTLRQREEAFQKRDLSVYLSCISNEYQDKNEDFGRLKTRMEGYFKTFDRIEYRSWDRAIEIAGDSAKAIQQFSLEVEKAGKGKIYSGKELLFLKKEGGKWKITGGL
jgi:ketosteroid isomerase-like protein